MCVFFICCCCCCCVQHWIIWLPGACSTAHRSNRLDHWDGLILDRSVVGQLSSLSGRTKWQRLPAGDTLRVQQLTCLTLGRPNGPAYSVGELLNTPLKSCERLLWDIVCVKCNVSHWYVGVFVCVKGRRYVSCSQTSCAAWLHIRQSQPTSRGTDRSCYTEQCREHLSHVVCHHWAAASSSWTIPRQGLYCMLCSVVVLYRSQLHIPVLHSSNVFANLFELGLLHLN